MADLHVNIGAGARDALCAAFASAHRSIEAQFYSLDESVAGALNDAARRGVAVTIRVEGDRCRYKHHHSHRPIDRHTRTTFARYDGILDHRIHLVAEADPLVLEHAKAAVVDGRRAFVATANPNDLGFTQPGEVMIEDDDPADVAAVSAAVAGDTSQSQRIVAGPDSCARGRIASLLDAKVDEQIASEDLSDPGIIGALIERRRNGLRDEVLAKGESHTDYAWLQVLAAAGVAVRTIPGAYLHDKYIDAGDRIYVGSANLTRNGLDEAREIGIIAPATDFGDDAAALRAEFNRMWSAATPLTAKT